MLVYSDIFRLSKIRLPASHMTYDIWNNDTILSTFLKPIFLIPDAEVMKLPAVEAIMFCGCCRRMLSANWRIMQKNRASGKLQDCGMPMSDDSTQFDLIWIWFIPSAIMINSEPIYGTTTYNSPNPQAAKKWILGEFPSAFGRQKCKSNALHLELTPFVA